MCTSTGIPPTYCSESIKVQQIFKSIYKQMGDASSDRRVLERNLQLLSASRAPIALMHKVCRSEEETKHGELQLEHHFVSIYFFSRLKILRRGRRDESQLQRPRDRYRRRPLAPKWPVSFTITWTVGELTTCRPFTTWQSFDTLPEAEK